MFPRVTQDVFDGSTYIIGMIEKHLPPRPAPDRVNSPSAICGAKPQAAGILHVRDHLLRLVFVLSNKHVNMVRENGACIARVTFTGDDFGEG